MSDDDRSAVTGEDVGLPLVDGEGNQIGVVSAVEGDDVVVDPDPDLTDDARATLGWGETENVRRTLRRTDLDRIPGPEAADRLPKYDRDHSADEEAVAAAVVRVDLGTVNRRG